MQEIDFNKIAPHGGSVQNAFEELCCQLAAKTRPVGTKFDRYRGDGGDGGVECKVIDRTGSTTGWQCKYVFNIQGLLKQVSKSLQTALSVHADLTRYVVCFPFDLTGKTGRGGKSQTEKFNEWVRKAEADARGNGRALTIERRSAHDIKALLLANDPSGGLRHYFFSATTFSNQWFADQIASAKRTAGPRYSRELNLDTPLSRWFSSFAESADWRKHIAQHLALCKKGTSQLGTHVETEASNSMRPEWPAAVYEKGRKLVEYSRSCIRSGERLAVSPTEEFLSQIDSLLSELFKQLGDVERDLSADINATHGEEASDSKRFRSYMEEYQVSFPAANLDAVRDLKAKWRALAEWLSSPSGFLALRQVFVLSGSGGTGKTHSLCDIAQKRLCEGANTCVVFGHQFRGEPDPWTRFAESLRIPLTLGCDGTLDALNAAAECSGKKLIICVDAVNETIPRSYWFDRLAAFAQAVASRTYLKLCVSCRTSFLPACLSKQFAAQAVEHKGFEGMEREACNAFFSHYHLEPPLVPVLQPELANPLYLKLVCETLQAKGLKQLPKGWFGMAPVIRAFLAHKEEQFATEYSVSAGATIVSGALRAIAAAIAQREGAALSWSEAQSAIDAAKPQAKGINVLQWLVTADLLIEDGPSTDALGAENFLRPAFERFGDFILASEMLDSLKNLNIDWAFKSGGRFADFVASARAVQKNVGLLSALSVLLPEKIHGMELADLIDDESIKNDVSVLLVRSLPWRTPETFLASTQRVLQEVLKSPDAFPAMDAMLAVSTQESKIDALWLHKVLLSLPFTKRDAFWCGYLKLSYEAGDIVRRIIEATTDLDLEKVEGSTAKRWCIVLLWFTAAADRRVKDSATRAATAILRQHPSVLPELVEQFLATDDDEIRERALLVAYGALIHSREETVLKTLAEKLLTAYEVQPDDFQNAIIRDHIRSIAELASHLGFLDPGLDPTLPNQRRMKTPQPDALPEDDEALDNDTESGSQLVVHSCLHDDFNHYSIDCLRGWYRVMAKPAIGQWIAKRVLNDFGYRGSNCSDYDSTITRATGGGRSKPAWAERIGKKYQWVAMYQLASRLYDGLDRETDSWERTTDRLPLILVEERKLDPTIITSARPDRNACDCWWIGDNVDLASTKQLDHTTWVNLRDDLPSMESLTAPKVHDGQHWLPLICDPNWSEYRANRPYGESYRSTWMQMRSFLVPTSQFERAMEVISRRNLFGVRLPENATWLYAFVGEYPWATACNVEADDWLGFNTAIGDSDVELVPVFNEVVCEWEYDGTLPSSIYFHVPARAFFEPGPLWWNSVDGFANQHGRTVFRDPSASEGGPTTLVADIDDLIVRLEKMGMRLVWTLLGEKTVPGNDARATPRVTFSQTAFLEMDGSIKVGERNFFERKFQDSH